MKHSFFTRHSLLILMVLAFSLSFIFMGTRRALQNNRNDVKKWLPDGFQETLDHAWFESHFPHEQFILMSWDKCKLGDPSLEMMASKMQRLTKTPFKEGQAVFFKDVITADALIEEIQSSFKSLEREEIIDRLRGSLVGPDGKQKVRAKVESCPLTLFPRAKNAPFPSSGLPFRVLGNVHFMLHLSSFSWGILVVQDGRFTIYAILSYTSLGIIYGSRYSRVIKALASSSPGKVSVLGSKSMERPKR